MSRRLQGLAAPGWNGACWVDSVKRWVIYANGSTGALPADAVFNADVNEWWWIEEGLQLVSDLHPHGERLMIGQPFDPGRAGGHLYALPFEVSPGRFLVTLINDATGFHAQGNLTVNLQPGWAWSRLGPGDVEPGTGRKLRRVHWMLTGSPRAGVTVAQLPFSLNRAYPEWPPEPRRRGP